MRVLALPRDPNPYQGLLYAQFIRRGHAVRYVGELTPSHTLNVLLLPFELAVLRRAGWDTLHIHWVFAFKLAGSERCWIVRRLARAWFTFTLLAARRVGLCVVWTAHNTLPHDRVFDDDLASRRRLTRECALVVAHSQATLAELARLEIVPRRAIVAPLGTFTPAVDAATLPTPGSPPRRLLFFGQVAEYKGVEELLTAITRLPRSSAVHLLVAGECRDQRLRSRLADLAAGQTDRVQLRLERLTDTDLTSVLAQADVVVLPFRRVSTSASALFALGYGRPLVIPDLPALAELPDDAVVRYDGTVDGLAHAIGQLLQWPAERLEATSRAGADYAASLQWDEAAAIMLDALVST